MTTATYYIAGRPQYDSTLTAQSDDLTCGPTRCSQAG